MITKVYVAGASVEIGRARSWMTRLRDVDITVTSTWPEVITRAGAPNPVDASPDQLTEWVLRDLAEAEASDVLWLLLPPKDVQTVGAYIELGAARRDRTLIVMSGGPHRSIFTPVLAHRSFDDDETAFNWILAGHREMIRRAVCDHRARWMPAHDESFADDEDVSS